MTDAQKIAALVAYRLEQADEALAAAELNLSNGLERSAVNCAYYAMFYAVLALLADRSVETSRHSGAIAQLDLLYVKSGVLRAELSPWLHKAFLHCQAADYGAEQTLTRTEIEELATQAREFIAETRKYFQRTANSGRLDALGASPRVVVVYRRPFIASVDTP